MSEFYGDKRSFCENICIDVENCRHVYWVNKIEPSAEMSEIAKGIIEKWESIDVQTIKIINCLEYTGVIGISLKAVWTTMKEYVEKYNTTPETLILVNDNNPDSVANKIRSNFHKGTPNYNIACTFPINWTADKAPYSIVLPSISDNDLYRCYKLNPPINVSEGGALIRTGEEFESNLDLTS